MGKPRHCGPSEAIHRSAREGWIASSALLPCANTSRNAGRPFHPSREGTNPTVAAYVQWFEFREASMRMSGIILAGCAAFIALGSAASAQTPMTGTVTRIDRLDGTVAIQLQRTPAQTTAQSGTVGANTSSPAEEVKTKVQGNLLN